MTRRWQYVVFTIFSAAIAMAYYLVMSDLADQLHRSCRRMSTKANFAEVAMCWDIVHVNLRCSLRIALFVGLQTAAVHPSVTYLMDLWPLTSAASIRPRTLSNTSSGPASSVSSSSSGSLGSPRGSAIGGRAPSNGEGGALR